MLGLGLVVAGLLVRRVEFAEREPQREPHIGVEIDIWPWLLPKIGIAMVVMGALVVVSIVAVVLAFPVDRDQRS